MKLGDLCIKKTKRIEELEKELKKTKDGFKKSEYKRDENGRFASTGEGNAQSKHTSEKTPEEFLGKKFTGYKDTAAINKLLEEKQGYIPDAFIRHDIGAIALVWGDENAGLCHIIKRRTQQGVNLKRFFEELADVINRGVMKKERYGRIKLTFHKRSAIIAPEFNGKDISFVLTAYEE